jgi:hypothetical protein
VKRNACCDAARALQGDVQTVQAVLPEGAPNGCLDTQKHAKRRVRTWVATDFIVLNRQTGDERRLAANLDHVRDTHADVLRRDVAAAQMIHGLAEHVQHIGRLRLVVGDDDRLTSTKRQAGHGILIAHPPRQPQRILQAVRRIIVTPIAAAACRRAQMGGVDGDDRFQPAFLVPDEVQVLVRVEILEAPGRGHRMEKVR